MYVQYTKSIPHSIQGGFKQHDLLFHFVKDQMLCNDREMTVKKVLVNPNDDAKGDDDRATTNCNESLSFPALLPISLTFL